MRTKDGLADGTIPRALHQFRIDERPGDEYRAYHYLLFNFFLYDGALVKSAARRDQEGRDA
ncbi:MAG: hypothetical protein RLZZ416_136 [Candidatus Parcubacteria bacterium]|jgi:hypothetical protein